MTASDISVQVADGVASIRALSNEWHDLESRTPEATGFQSFEWCFTWARIYGELESPSYKCKVIVVREGGRPVYLLPLQIERKFGIRWARGLGQPLTQYADALAEPGARRCEWRRITEDVIKSWSDVDTISMLHVRSDGVLANGGRGGVNATTRSAPFLHLRDPTAVRQALRTGRTLRRRMQLLARRGDIVLDMQAAQDCQTRLHEALALKSAWMRARGIVYSTILEPVAIRFLEEFSRSKSLMVHRLLVGHQTAALDVGLLAGNAYRSLLSTYDLSFANGSPGHVLTRLLIEQLALDGFREFDLLSPADPYKQAVSSGSVPLLSLHRSFNFRGRAGNVASLYLRGPWSVVKDIRYGFEPQTFRPPASRNSAQRR